MKITQKQLILVMNAQRELREASEVLKEKKAACEAAETPVRQGLLDGSPVERGPMLVSLARTERRNVAWRKVVEEKLGKDETERIANATEPTVYHAVVVAVRGGK